MFPELDIDCFADDNSRRATDLRQGCLVPERTDRPTSNRRP